jgi:hypothetical protein
MADLKRWGVLVGHLPRSVFGFVFIIRAGLLAQDIYSEVNHERNGMNRIKLISTSCALAFALCLPLTAWAQGNPTINTRVPALEAAVSALQTSLTMARNDITALQTGLTAANAQISVLQAAQGPLAALAPLVSVVPGPINGLAGPHVIITGANVHIRNGHSSPPNPDNPTASFNGLGNLLIGYNEAPPDLLLTDRGGSHNLIVGPQHRYSNYGGLVAGHSNTIEGPFASISGGYDNFARGHLSSVSGGTSNHAYADYSGISGGGGNTIEPGAEGASVSGGQQNTASGVASSVSGGERNVASGAGSSVSGGQDRVAAGTHDWRAGNLFEDF